MSDAEFRLRRPQPGLHAVLLAVLAAMAVALVLRWFSVGSALLVSGMLSAAVAGSIVGWMTPHWSNVVRGLVVVATFFAAGLFGLLAGISWAWPPVDSSEHATTDVENGKTDRDAIDEPSDLENLVQTLIAECEQELHQARDENASAKIAELQARFGMLQATLEGMQDPGGNQMPREELEEFLVAVQEKNDARIEKTFESLFRLLQARSAPPPRGDDATGGAPDGGDSTARQQADSMDDGDLLDQLRDLVLLPPKILAGLFGFGSSTEFREETLGIMRRMQDGEAPGDDQIRSAIGSMDNKDPVDQRAFLEELRKLALETLQEEALQDFNSAYDAMSNEVLDEQLKDAPEHVKELNRRLNDNPNLSCDEIEAILFGGQSSTTPQVLNAAHDLLKVRFPDRWSQCWTTHLSGKVQ